MNRNGGPRFDPERRVWTVRVRTPDGKRRRVSAPTKKACAASAAALVTDVARGSYVAPRRQSFDDLAGEWLLTVEANLAAGTHARYRRDLARARKRIGHVQIQALDVAALNRLYAELAGDGLGPSTIRATHVVVGKVLGDAVRWGRLVRNPARLADPPSPRRVAEARPEGRTWTGPEVEEALRQWRDVRHGAAWSFMVATGVRPGECLGLRWSDVDLDGCAASIRQAITSVDHRPHTGPTKTGKARRIDLDARTVSMLRSHRAMQAEERLALGAGYGEGDFVFALPDGRPYHPDHFNRAFSRWLERSGLPAFRLYDVRHTHATLLLEAGVDVKVVADRLGNSAQVVWTTYQHVRPQLGLQAAEAVAGLIFGTARTQNGPNQPGG
jgi:integrase